MSGQLIWKLTKDNSSFLKKQTIGTNKVEFTTEPFNMTSVNSRRSSGLANDKGM